MLTLALPAIIEMGLNTLLGVADTLMISRFIGAEALSAVGNANQIFFVLIFIFSSFNTGATALVSRSYGEGDFHKLNRVAAQATFLNILIGAVITLLAFRSRHLLFLVYDLTPAVRGLAIDYFAIVALSIPLMFIAFSYAAVLRGAGDTKTPMIITGIMNIANIIGNYVLITGFGPFPEMGVAGAALATTLSRLLGFFLYTYVLFVKHTKVRIKLQHMALTKDILSPLWQISYPGAIEQTLMQLSFLIGGIIITTLDTASEAAFRIILSIESLSFMPAVGLSIAAAALVGKSLGEKDVDKAETTGFIAAELGILWGILMGAVFLLFPETLLGIYDAGPSLIALSALTMIVAGFNQPFLNFMIVLSGALRGAGDTRAVLMITTARLWLFFVPLTYLFIVHLDRGIAGFWMAEITSFLFTSILLYRRFRSRKWARLSFEPQATMAKK